MKSIFYACACLRPAGYVLADEAAGAGASTPFDPPTFADLSPIDVPTPRPWTHGNALGSTLGGRTGPLRTVPTAAGAPR